MPPEQTVDRQIDDDWIGEYYSRIHRAAWLMTGDAWAAEDLAQETFVVALDQWSKFEGRSSESTWLHGILMQLHRRRNRMLGRLRQRLLKYAERMDSNPRPSQPDADLAEKEWRSSIWADVANLPDAQREAITLKFAEDMTYEQIADALGCAEGTAKTRVHHGLKKLRDWVGEDQSTNALSSGATQPIPMTTQS